MNPPAPPAPPNRSRRRHLLAALASLALLTTAATLAFAPTARAQGLAIKYYDGGFQAGQASAALTQAPDGNFYGTPLYGSYLFRLTPEGQATAVYRFSALADDGTNAEGSRPVGGLLLGRDGNLYGLTNQGGAHGFGTVFRFTTDGTVTAVGSLTAAVKNFGNLDGYPTPLVQDRAGNFYVISFTVTNDGTSTTLIEAILKVALDGTVSTYHVFTPPDANGRNPEGYGVVSGLVIDGQDNLYGFAAGGGAGGLGTFFQIAPGGQALALHNYNVDHQDTDPTPQDLGGVNSIVTAPDGTIYGVASNLGAPSQGGGPGVGTYQGGGIFKAAAGVLTPLYAFSPGVFQNDGFYRNTDGIIPTGLTIGPDGNLYGVTGGGGANGFGTVFKLTPGGGFTLLYTFPPGVSTQHPPTLSTNGDLYGSCGSDFGTFYRLGATLLPVFNAPTLTATATQGVPFSFQLVAANDPDTYAASGLPAGLSLDATTGLLTGATTAPLGTYPVSLIATNADGTSTATLTITVQAPSPDAPAITVPSTPLSATVGTPFSYQIDATNKPTSYQITGLPSGVTYDPKTGLIHGLFANAGKILLQVQVQNASGTGSASLEIDVAAANSLPVVTLAATANADVTTGQAGAFTLSLSAASGADLTIHYTVKGSAIPGTDYQMLKGTAKIKAGKTSKAIKVVPVGDLGGASKKTVVLTLQPGTGYTVGTTGKVKIKITSGQ